MDLIYLKIVVILIGSTHSYLYGGFKDLSFRRRYYGEDGPNKVSDGLKRFISKNVPPKIYDKLDVKSAYQKNLILQKVRNLEERLNNDHNLPLSKPNDKNVKEYYHIDPVLNELRRKTLHSFRRRGNSRRKKKYSSENDTSTSSSSLEIPYWREEFKEQWLKKKFEAVNSSGPFMNGINMMAARPWGVPCGDHLQHDMPWGTCTLPQECDPEYRIYRGDHFCGRSQFICCAISVSNYDLYQGVDISFEDSRYETDTEEKIEREKNKSSDEKKRSSRKRARSRQRARDKRKRKLRKEIRKIVRMMRRMLNRLYRNATRLRERKTRWLKDYVSDLKKQYKRDRKAVRWIHENEMIKIDDNLMRKLKQIRAMNQNFMKNDTFRDIIVNGTMNETGKRMLLEAYPELGTELSLRSGRRNKDRRDTYDFVDYDVEYGLLYQ